MSGRSGAVRGISIGFRTKKAAKRPRGGRTIQELELLEASLVTIPMHPGARVTSAKTAVRALSLAAALSRPEDLWDIASCTLLRSASHLGCLSRVS